MNLRSVFHLISYMVLFVALAAAFTSGISALCADPSIVVFALLKSSGLMLAIGCALWFGTRSKKRVDLSRKDGFGIVTLGWLVVANVGSIPYLMVMPELSAVDAFFETMSGFTTTGASIFREVDGLPYGILFWRALTQWLGGMGVLLLCVAILPFLGIGGMQIYRAEMPGPSKDRLTPRIANTAKLLYGVYVLLTLIQTVALYFAGMQWFDAICHAFCTLSTGGFSTHTASVAHYQSPAITVIITVFMLIGGINFALHYRFLRREWNCYGTSSECKYYLLVFLFFTCIVAGELHGTHYDSLIESLIQSGFQIASLLTGTGFATTDYDNWPLFSTAILFFLMFSGACAGSTSGGVKIMRSMVMVKECFRQIRLFMQPQAVIKVKLDKQTIPSPVVAGITAFLLCFLLVFAVVTLLMTMYLPDLRSAASATIACLGNVGPGLGSVGPTRNFADVAASGKVILSICMMLGRLELFTVLILLYPSVWKR